MRRTDTLRQLGAVPANKNKSQPLPRIRSDRKRSGNLLMNLPIGTRLTLSFIISALIAAMVTGTIGFQHAQSLNRQSEFYLNLLESNTNLTTGEQFLQEISSVTQNILVLANTPQSSLETLRTNLTSLQNLDNLYSNTINSFVADQLVSVHPDQKALLDEANHGQQVKQQETLSASALRTWRVAHVILGQFVSDINGGHFDTAATLQQALLEPANADALASLRSLVNFNKRLANSVKDAADVEAYNQLITTVVSSVLTFMGILLIGWLISGTIVRRLRALRQVTQAVENGNFARRARVVGRDEIADVSASVNAMLDAIANLVDEIRNQRDVLVNAADHLFSDIRVVSAGDLRVNAPVTNDPIGMLANAFNLAIGRFRRFVLRTKTLSEQLSVIAHREAERAEAFSLTILSIQPTAHSQSISDGIVDSSGIRQKEYSGLKQVESQTQNTQLMALVRRMREQLRRISQEEILNHTYVAGELNEQVTHTLNRLNGITRGELVLARNANLATVTHAYAQEFRALDELRVRIAGEIQSMQQSAIRCFQDLDQDLQQLSTGLRQRSGSPETVSSVITEEDPHLQDMVRLGVTFATEVMTLSRQLTKLSQEMQSSVVSFQFDATDAPNMPQSAALSNAERW